MSFVFKLIGVMTVSINIIKLAFSLPEFFQKFRNFMSLINVIIFKSDLPELYENSIRYPKYNNEFLYRNIFRYYDRDKKRYFPDYKYLDYNYFVSCLPFLYKLSESQIQLMNFPILFKPQWCLSNNEDFGIETVYNNQEKTNDLNERAMSAMKEYTGETYFFDYFKKRFKNDLFDSQTYDLCSLTDDNHISMIFSKGSYRQLMNFNEAIARESKYLCHMYSTQIPPTSDYRLGKSLRARIFHKSLLSKSRFRIRNKYPLKNILDYKSFPCSIGLNVFTILKAKGRFYTFIQKRPDDMAENPGMSHVLPAGTFQPHPSNPDEEWSKQCDFKYTVFRELLEEMFDVEFMQKPGSNDATHFVDISIPILDIKTREKKMVPVQDILPIRLDDEGILEGEFTIVPTSFIIDMVPVKPQVSLVLYFESDYLYDLIQTSIIGSKSEGPMLYYDLDSRAFEEFVKDNLNVTKFTQPGSIAVAEGYHYFRKYINPIHKIQNNNTYPNLSS